MSARISIDTGLVVRYGAVTYRMNNFIDNRSAVMFQNQETGEFRKFAMSEFVAKLQSGALVPVIGDQTETVLGQDGKRVPSILDVSSLPPKIIEEINLRQTCCRFMSKRGIRRGQRTKIAKAATDFFDQFDKKNAKENKPPVKRYSPSAIMGWMRDYEMAGKNVSALVSGNFNRRRASTVNEDVEKEMDWALDRYYLTKARFSLTFAFERLQDRLKEQVAAGKIKREAAAVSFATFLRRKDALDPYMVTLRRYGPAKAKHDFRATFEGTQIPRAMARLEVDHTLLNWVVVCDRTGLPLGRPTLTIVIDSYSGYLVGLYVSFNGPGLTSVLNVMKNSIRPKDAIATAAGTAKPWIAWGVGDCFILDNGMEFHSKAFQMAAWELCTDIEYCRVRTPWLKPRVERFFANLDYLPLVKGRVFKAMANVLHVDPKKDGSITLSALCQGLVIFASDIFPYERNSRTGAFPVELFAESIAQSEPPEMPLSLAGLDMIAAMSKPHTVSHGGVELYGLTYAGADLREMVASAGGKFRTLVKWDPEDMSSVYAQHARTQEWVALHCTRKDYAYGLTFNQHKLIRKFSAEQYGKSGMVDHLVASKLRLSEMWMEPIVKGGRRLDLSAAKKYAQTMASARMDVDIDTPSRPATRVMAEDQLAEVEVSEIPTFETFVMNC